ncbi:MAG: peptidase M20, partial [Sphingomonas sp.]
PLATPDALDQGSLQDIGRQTLDLSRALLAAPTLPGKAPDLVFYDLFGLVFLAYAGWVGWLILAAAAGAYAYAGWGVTSLRHMGRGLGVALATLVVGGILLTLGNLASGADGPVNYYDRLAAIPRLEIQAVLLCLAASTLVAGSLLNRRPIPELLPAIAAPFLLLAIIAQALAPTAAFPLQIPLLLGGIGAAVMRWRPGPAGNWTMTAMAALGTGYVLTLGHALFQAMGPDMPFLMVLPLALSALLLLPLFLRIERPRAMKEAAVLTVLALGVALWVRFDAVAASAAVYSQFH